MTNRLLNEYLASLRYEANPFLFPPEQLRARGFRGLPYVLAKQSDELSQP
jgi:hypothetical protein